MAHDRDRIDALALTVAELSHIARALIDRGEQGDAAPAALSTLEPKDGTAMRFHPGEQVRTALPGW